MLNRNERQIVRVNGIERLVDEELKNEVQDARIEVQDARIEVQDARIEVHEEKNQVQDVYDEELKIEIANKIVDPYFHLRELDPVRRIERCNELLCIVNEAWIRFLPQLQVVLKENEVYDNDYDPPLLANVGSESAMQLDSALEMYARFCSVNNIYHRFEQWTEKAMLYGVEFFHFDYEYNIRIKAHRLIVQ